MNKEEVHAVKISNKRKSVSQSTNETPNEKLPEDTKALIEKTPPIKKKMCQCVCWLKFQVKCEKFVNNPIFSAIMGVMTIYALFADDTRQIIDFASNPEVDNVFYGISSVCFALFMLEIIVSCIGKRDYFLGFYFWLDLISTLTLIFDIGWMSDAIFGTGAGNSGAVNAAQLARAGRASRVGTRAARIVRIIRLIRLIRLLKMYKAAQANMLKESDGGTHQHGSNSEAAGQSKRSGSVVVDDNSSSKRKQSINEGGASQRLPVPGRKASEDNANSDRGSETEIKEKKNEHVRKSLSEVRRSDEFKKDGKKEEKKEEEIDLSKLETNVGKKLGDLTVRRVVVLVLAVMICIPVFDVGTYTSPYLSRESGLYSINDLNSSGNNYIFLSGVQFYTNTHYDDRDPLVALYYYGDTLYPVYPNLTIENSLRENEKLTYNLPSQNGSSDQSIGSAIYSQKVDTTLNGILGILRTIFVTVVLAGGALLFNKDSNDLVLAPIEAMVTKVRRIAENPLEAAQIEEQEALLYETLEKQGKLKDLKKSKETSNFETAVLERTILKLGALLALGFGEAGSEIIAANMAKSGEVDPMIPGKKMMAIFGFCDIRNFTDATEVLQEGVMVFVNEIAEIVHSTINHFSGAANKNIGDAFLLVWKFQPDDVETDPENQGNLRLRHTRAVQQVTDMSIISFLKIIGKINRSLKLEKYRHNAGLNERLPNYSVKMGFGLHVGWAIEGAIGSEFKIDASYLSPNVNMASRLEAATKQYGAPILISGVLYNLASPETRKQLRLIDRVTVKGSLQPVDLYTCDLEWANLTINHDEFDINKLPSEEKKKSRVRARLKRDDQRDKAFSGKQKVGRIFHTDKDLAMMREPFTQEFYARFAQGMEHYLKGTWEQSIAIFKETLVMIPGRKDGPSNTLLEFMESEGGRAPSNWAGYRALTEK